MKKIAKIVLVAIYLFVVVFTTIMLFTYNKYGLSVIDKSTFIIINSDEFGKYKEGNLVISNGSNKCELKKGEKIFYYNTYSNSVKVEYDKILEVEKATNKSDVVYLLNNDLYVSCKDVIGSNENSKNIALVGSILNVLESKVGFLLIVVLPILIAFLREIYLIIKEFKQKR